MNRLLSLTIGLLLAFAATPVAAQELKAVVTGPSDIAVGRTLVLDALSSLGTDENASYRWYRDDIRQPISENLEAVFTPEQAGETVIRLEITATIDGQRFESIVRHPVIVYDRKIAVIADVAVPPEKLVLHQTNAREQGVYLPVIQPQEGTLPIGIEESLSKAIADRPEALTNAEAIVMWTDGVAGLQALARTLEGEEDRLNALANQTIVVITEGSLQTLARTLRGPFSVLMPDQIVVTRKEALNPLLSATGVTVFTTDLEQRDIDFFIVDESSVSVRPWNLISSLVNYMVTHGVSSQTVLLLLMLPVIATILAFLKQIVGITTFGLYLPSVIALSFLALGWKVGLLFLIFILITGYSTRQTLKRWRLLYIPKVAILLTVVSFTLLLMLGVGAYLGLTLAGDTIFILLILSTLSETLVTTKAEKGLYGAVLGVSETVLAALLCVFIVQWPALQSVVLAYPEVIVLTLFINVLLGKWTGLRLVEYFRFKEVFKHINEE